MLILEKGGMFFQFTEKFPSLHDHGLQKSRIFATHLLKSNIDKLNTYQLWILLLTYLSNQYFPKRILLVSN